MRRLDPTEVVLAVGLVVIAGYVAALAWLMEHSTYDTWGALVIAPILVIITLPLLARAARVTDQPWLFAWGSVALGAKLVGAYVRYLVAFQVYGGAADAAQYNHIGAQLSQQFRHGNFDQSIRSGGIGTKFIQSVTGVIYTITGPTLIGGYLVFAWLGFLGLLMAYLAFHTAIPEGFQKRYAALVFFLPSLLFWTSGLGKEAWMTLGIGLSMWGAARLMAHRRGGLVMLAVGLVETGVVRPHVTVLLVVSVLVAYLVRPSPRVTAMTPLIKIGGVVVLVIATYVTVRVAANFLGVQDMSASGFEGALSNVQSRTNEGGSAFGGAVLASPLGLPRAVVTVLFRPLPWEAHNMQALASSLESAFLIFLFWRYRRSVLNAFRLLRKSPYVTFCLSYVFGYVVIFAGFSNFGILVRERSLTLSALVVLLALPAAARSTRDGYHPHRRAMALR
jgi:hypothetical protein